MIRRVKRQLLKLENIGLCQEIARVHMVRHRRLRRIIPAALGGTGFADPALGCIVRRFLNQTLVAHLLRHGRIKIKPRLHRHKSPVRMGIFQTSQGRLVRPRKSADIRSVHRISHHGKAAHSISCIFICLRSQFQNRKQVIFLPGYPVFIGVGKVVALHIPRALRAVQKILHLIPDVILRDLNALYI